MTIEQWVAETEKRVQADYSGHGYTVPTLSVHRGQKYARVSLHTGPQTHAYCFVEIATGNILKANGSFPS